MDTHIARNGSIFLKGTFNVDTKAMIAIIIGNVCVATFQNPPTLPRMKTTTNLVRGSNV